jgi:hypothetical protein
MVSSKYAPVASPALVHFPIFNSASSCPLLEEDFGCNRDIWKFCLIGYVAGKFSGYTALTKLMTSYWNYNVSLSIHNFGWLIFKFHSEADKLGVLRGGPYFVFGRSLVLKTMPKFFYFNPADMSTAPVWVRFPNFLLNAGL